MIFATHLLKIFFIVGIIVAKIDIILELIKKYFICNTNLLVEHKNKFNTTIVNITIVN